MPVPSTRRAAGVAAACVVSFGVVLGVAVTSAPFHNWDMIMYVGVANLFGGGSVQGAHDEAYADARRAVSAGEYQDLTAGIPFREEVARSAESFRELVPFYAVKPAYPALIACARALGVGGSDASVAISRICLALLAALCCFWLSCHLGLVAAILLAIAVTATPYVFILGRFSTPDALSALSVAGAACIAARTRGVSVGLMAVLAASLLVRPDNLIFALAICAALAAVEPPAHRRAVVAGTICLAVCAVLVAANRYYGWPAQFRQSFLGPNAYPRSRPEAVTILDVLRTYARLAHPRESGIFVGMLMVAGLSVVSARAAFGARSRLYVVAFATAIALALDWLVAPSSNERLRSGYHCVSLLILCVSVARLAGPPGSGRWTRLA